MANSLAYFFQSRGLGLTNEARRYAQRGVATNHNYFVGKANILVHNKTRKLRLVTTKKLNEELLNQTELSDESKTKK
jgi:hypothetical protein